MLSLLQKYVEIRQFRIAAVFAIIYMLLFNSAVFIYKLEFSKIVGIRVWLELGKDFTCMYLALVICFLGLTVQRLVFYVGAVLLFITGATASYYLYFFHIIPTEGVIRGLFHTNLAKLESIDIKLITWLVFSFLICLYMIKYFRVQQNKYFVTHLLTATCLLISINTVISPPYEILKNYFPSQYLHNYYSYLTKK